MAFALGAIEQEMMNAPRVEITTEDGCDCCDSPRSVHVMVHGYVPV